jgi:hypothetical protein
MSTRRGGFDAEAPERAEDPVTQPATDRTPYDRRCSSS